VQSLFVKHRYIIFFLGAVLIHIVAFALLRFSTPPQTEVRDSDYEILKLVDVEEYIPPPEKPDTTIVYNQPVSAETVITTEDDVVEVQTDNAEPDYTPQHKISIVPGIPTQEVLDRIEYPPIALRQGVEGVVYLELYIDREGLIRKIRVLKDPGFGFADAAVAALTGLRCKPAYANGVPVAVRFRYPVRFTVGN